MKGYAGRAAGEWGSGEVEEEEEGVLLQLHLLLSRAVQFIVLACFVTIIEMLITNKSRSHLLNVCGDNIMEN